MAARLNIAALARRTGVQPDTLRKWEARYGVLRPERTPGGQRRYGDRDVARVEWLKARLAEGYRIREAASLLGDAGLDAPQTADDLAVALHAAAIAGDGGALDRVVEQALAVLPLEQALLGAIAPALVRVGAAWEAGELTVAQEHLTSAVVRSHLERRLTDARAAVRGTAVLACAPGERHELGLLMLAVLLRADGWHVAYLGADTPSADAARLAAELAANVLCVSATLPEAAAAAASLVPSGELRVLLGGPGIRGGERDLSSVVRSLRG